MSKYDVTLNIIIDCEMSSELLSRLLENEAAIDDFVVKNCFRNNERRVLAADITNTWLHQGAPAQVKAKMDYVKKEKEEAS